MFGKGDVITTDSQVKVVIEPEPIEVSWHMSPAYKEAETNINQKSKTKAS